MIDENIIDDASIFFLVIFWNIWYTYCLCCLPWIKSDCFSNARAKKGDFYAYCGILQDILWWTFFQIAALLDISFSIREKSLLLRIC